MTSQYQGQRIWARFELERFLSRVLDHVSQSLLDTMTYLPTPGLAPLRRYVQLSNVIAQKSILSPSLDRDDKKHALRRIGIRN